MNTNKTKEPTPLEKAYYKTQDIQDQIFSVENKIQKSLISGRKCPKTKENYFTLIYKLMDAEKELRLLEA